MYTYCSKWGFLLITLPCSTSTYHTLALPQMWTWAAFKRIFDCLRKEGCSELTPRARISDTRIPQLMQP